MQPSEIELLPFWEVEQLVDDLHELAKEEEAERKKQEGAEKHSTSSMPNVSSYQRQMASAMNTHMPTMPSFKF